MAHALFVPLLICPSQDTWNRLVHDWIKLAMPASITLLAIAVFSVPLIGNAQISHGSEFRPVHVKLVD